eukprot:3570363-Alexandrium_andersonii.AAC.1
MGRSSRSSGTLCGAPQPPRHRAPSLASRSSGPWARPSGPRAPRMSAIRLPSRFGPRSTAGARLAPPAAACRPRSLSQRTGSCK